MSDHSDEEMHHNDSSVGEGEIVTAPSLYLRPTYYRQTRKKGKIIKQVSERYLRDDLGLGCYYVDDNVGNLRVKEAAVGKPRTIADTEHLLSILKLAMQESPFNI